MSDIAAPAQARIGRHRQVVSKKMKVVGPIDVRRGFTVINKATVDFVVRTTSVRGAGTRSPMSRDLRLTRATVGR